MQEDGTLAAMRADAMRQFGKVTQHCHERARDPLLRQIGITDLLGIFALAIGTVSFTLAVQHLCRRSARILLVSKCFNTFLQK